MDGGCLSGLESVLHHLSSLFDDPRKSSYSFAALTSVGGRIHLVSQHIQSMQVFFRILAAKNFAIRFSSNDMFHDGLVESRALGIGRAAFGQIVKDVHNRLIKRSAACFKGSNLFHLVT